MICLRAISLLLAFGLCGSLWPCASLGSTSALQQILTGADFGTNTIDPEILLSSPSAYQLMPHPIVDFPPQKRPDIEEQPSPILPP